MGNVLKRTKVASLNHTFPHGLYKRKSKSFSTPNKGESLDFEDNEEEIDEANSWTTTIGTQSTFSASLPTGEDERSTDDKSTNSQDDCTLSDSNYSDRSLTTSITTSNTSADFSSFKNLSEISEHTTMHPRPDDIEWMNDVQQYLESEPVFRKKPFKAALKTQSRKVFPQLKWHQLYHQWALRQIPEAYKGKDVLNPYINQALEEKTDIDLNSSDLEHGIFYLKCTTC